jgi:prepilin-type processing-associated H-X9-DG protein
MSSNPPGGAAKTGMSTWIIVAVVLACLAVFMFCLLGIAVALLLPAIQAAREAARRSQCSNDLRQIGTALLTYEQTHHSLPPAYLADADGRPMHSWRVLILPYFGDAQLKNLYDQYDFNEPWNGPKNSKLAERMPSQYRCPSDPGEGPQTNYLAVVGEETAWPGTGTTRVAEIRDGMAGTILVVESADAHVNWMEPRDLAFDQAARGINPGNQPSISSHHPGGANVLFCDGHLQFMNDQTPAAAVRGLLTVSGGENIDPALFSP